MKTKKDNYQSNFILLLFLFTSLMILLVSQLNSYFNNLFTSYRIVILTLRIPLLSVVIAPINEEIVKFLGYAVIYIFGMRWITALNYSSKKKFRNDYLIIAFLISAGGFGLLEGVSHNLGFGLMCLIAFTSLNTMAHITYSIYPYLLGRKYKNWFILFLPIGILLHSVHNFVIDNIWDNKWVTFTIVTTLLLPIIFMERKNLYKIYERLNFKKVKNPQKVNRILIIVFVLLYCYIFLCVWLRFS